MPEDQIIAFLIFALVAAITPGPSNLLVLAAGSTAGFVGGLRCLAGVVTGMASLMSAGSLGLGGVTDAWPQTLAALQWLGSIFLLWLAWQVASAPPVSGQHNSIAVGFWKAFGFQWINPKSWVVTFSAVSVYGSQTGQSGLDQALQMGGLFALAALLSCSVWLIAGAALKQWLGDARRARLFNRTMGALLALSVVLVWG